MVCAADLMLADIYSAQVYKGRRRKEVSVNYVIACVNSKDSVSMSFKFLADVQAPCFLFPSLHQEAATQSAMLFDYVAPSTTTHLLFIKKTMSSSMVKKKVGSF